MCRVALWWLGLGLGDALWCWGEVCCGDLAGLNEG